MMDDSDDDLRATELETLEAIYPELIRLDGPGEDSSLSSQYVFELQIPVVPQTPAKILFAHAQGSVSNSQQLQQQQQVADPSELSHLPSITLQVELPKGYPEAVPPKVSVSTSPAWLPNHKIRELQQDSINLWEEMGRDLVAFAYVDHVQRAAEDAFGLVGTDGLITVDPEHKLTMLDYDIEAKKAAFDRETFDCGVCLDPKKGSQCHKMIDCGHIFCLECLQEFYNNAITSGDLTVVRCLEPNCAKERSQASKQPETSEGSAKAPKKVKTFISPSELLTMGLSEDTVKRFVMLKYKTQLESDKNTIYCPRSWCNGAARSKKHKKPAGLEFQEASDCESDDQDGETADSVDEKGKIKKKPAKFDPADLLAVCEDCHLAFCSRCLQSWHGEFVRCTGKKTKEAISAEEQASLEYLKLHTSPCPTCGAPAQKTHGCNHMLCSRCETHFCYLCSAWLEPGNPYKHYNTLGNGKVTSCYMRLWELEGGDGDDVGLGYQGGDAVAGAAGNHPPPNIDPDLVAQDVLLEVDDVAAELGELRAEDQGPIPDDNPADRRPRQIGQAGAVAREAPLVLRIFDNPAAAAAAADAPPPRPDGPGGAMHNQQQNHRQQQGQGQDARNRRGAQGPLPVRGLGARGRNRLPNAAGGRGGNIHNRRGRGGRGGQAQQQQQQQQQQMNQQRDARGQVHLANVPLEGDEAAWVRRFVEMALADREHLHEDIDFGDDDWDFR